MARIVMPMFVLRTIKDLVCELSSVSAANVGIYDWLPVFLRTVKGRPAVMISPGEPFIETTTTLDAGADNEPFDDEKRVYRAALEIVTRRRDDAYEDDLVAHLELVEDIKVQLNDKLPDRLTFLQKDGEWLDSTTIVRLLDIKGEKSRHELWSQREITIPTIDVTATHITDF